MDFSKIPSPAFVLDEKRLHGNLQLIKSVQEAADVDIILALKGFAMWSVFPIVGSYLKGATASSLNEARLIFEEMGVKAHTYAVAYDPQDFDEMLQYSSHLTFNSVQQYRQYKDKVEAYAEPISCGLRVNPEYSEVETDLYNPAAKGGRLGISAEHLENGLPAGIEGLHFHTLCESSAYELEKTLVAFEQKFGHLLSNIKWVNMGGGHLMTRKGYDTQHLIQLLRDFKARHQVEIILEPGSAIAWDCGPLLATVLDIVENRGQKTAIVDVSFTAHMPDTLEMPYRPKIREASAPVSGKPTYRIGGVSCLAGDYMEAYSFEQALQVGDQLIFEDMMHYTLVKTTMFNGVKHPSICIWRDHDELEIIRQFTYEDYKNRLS